ncbi:hypothetical protein OsJ_27408 [Oryza sativa Japonica Group]|uniref:Uncharacterized protein n=1 Tax=Oryza sativa subsp. japonica TaxID=39947 RepID=B9G114_ORYSJ|nr:hypothetical protein OsJ_27408 [Oryza sativa Japonica Group]
MATLARLKEARPRRASRPTPHRRGGDGRRRRRHRALLGGAARIAHPSPLGLISGSLHFLRVLLKILPSLSTLTGIADSIYLLRLQKQALFRRPIGPLTDVLAC